MTPVDSAKMLVPDKVQNVTFTKPILNAALLIARLLLAGVFVVGGLSTLVDRVGSRQTLTDLGVPALLATQLKILLPLAEFAVAATLIPSGRSATGLA